MGTILSERGSSSSLTAPPSPRYLSRLWLGHYRFAGDYHFHSGQGTPVNSIGVPVRGRALFVNAVGQFELGPGQAVYVPQGEKYESFWTGNPGVEWLALHFLFVPQQPVPGADSSQRFLLQPLPEWDAAAHARFEQISAGAVGGVPSLEALGHFYLLFSDLSPKLAHRQTESVPNPVQEALLYIEAHPCDDYGVARLAELCGMAESSFYAAFAACTGCTPVAYRNRVRIQRAITLLLQTDRTVESISRELNFCTPAYFRRVFQGVTGKTPRAYRLGI